MRKVLLNVCILFACSISANAQISLSAGTTISETFNAMTTGTSLPAHWQMSPAGGGAAATFQNPATTNFTAVSEVANSGSPITAGRYNWGNNAGADRAIGFMTSGSYVSPNAIMAWYQNNSGATVTSLTVTFQIERYRVNTFLSFRPFGIRLMAAPGQPEQVVIFLLLFFKPGQVPTISSIRKRFTNPLLLQD
jgi:hypothetical protein